MFRKDHNHHPSEKKIIHLNACCNVIAIHKLKTDLKLGKLQLRMVWLVVFILHHATKEPRPLQVKNSWRKRETSGLCSRAFNATPVVCLRTNVPQSSTEKWFVKCREFQACLGSDSLTVSLFQMLGIWTGVPRSYALQHDMTDQFWPAGLAEKEVWSNAKCQENHGCRGMKRWMQGNLRGNNLKMETSKIWSQESLQEARDCAQGSTSWEMDVACHCCNMKYISWVACPMPSVYDVFGYIYRQNTYYSIIEMPCMCFVDNIHQYMVFLLMFDSSNRECLFLQCDRSTIGGPKFWPISRRLVAGA